MVLLIRFIKSHLQGYYGTDYPQTWPLPPLESVHMTLENTVHCTEDSPIRSAEWNRTLPRGGGMLHLGDDMRTFSISMFHQLRCLNIIQASIAESQNHIGRMPTSLDLHCMNYIRQMILCRSSLRLESVRSVKEKSGNTVSDVTHTCRDWSAVFAAAEENYDIFLTHSPASRSDT
ncbi:uncharacterized protein FIBRA_08815 [Fibroporia radiculosa]|uniref:Uncharacterized protein n=1 Tax=Fibroporia radiculosa TaxID=599839 RepID=J4ICJ9_9APHY|nr:uncharacterized protein FIBRA_08815 [Fibroporia radiculosa]CCM06541.1 predicted protein [Fibroporia radiculosa]